MSDSALVRLLTRMLTLVRRDRAAAEEVVEQQFATIQSQLEYLQSLVDQLDAESSLTILLSSRLRDSIADVREQDLQLQAQLDNLDCAAPSLLEVSVDLRVSPLDKGPVRFVHGQDARADDDGAFSVSKAAPSLAETSSSTLHSRLALARQITSLVGERQSSLVAESQTVLRALQMLQSMAQPVAHLRARQDFAAHFGFASVPARAPAQSADNAEISDSMSSLKTALASFVPRMQSVNERLSEAAAIQRDTERGPADGSAAGSAAELECRLLHAVLSLRREGLEAEAALQQAELFAVVVAQRAMRRRRSQAAQELEEMRALLEALGELSAARERRWNSEERALQDAIKQHSGETDYAGDVDQFSAEYLGITVTDGTSSAASSSASDSASDSDNIADTDGNNRDPWREDYTSSDSLQPPLVRPRCDRPGCAPLQTVTVLPRGDLIDPAGPVQIVDQLRFASTSARPRDERESESRRRTVAVDSADSAYMIVDDLPREYMAADRDADGDDDDLYEDPRSRLRVPPIVPHPVQSHLDGPDTTFVRKDKGDGK